MKYLFLFIFIYSKVNAQNYINYSNAIKMALENNLQIKNEKLKIAYLNKLKNSAINIDNTNISLEYGQFNSIYKDNKITISQNFAFPTVYIAQNNLYKLEIKKSLIDTEIKNKDLIKNVSNVFYNYLILKEKEKLLLSNDSIYNEFVNKSKLKFNIGEINILEKITAETNQGQIKMQLKQLEQDIKFQLLQFQLLLNIEEILEPKDDLKINKLDLTDNLNINNNPLLLSLLENIKIKKLNIKIEKNKLLPNLFLGYNNLTIQGNGSDNKEYTIKDRFQSFQIGLGIPIFFNTQKAKIGAAKIDEYISKNNYEYNKNIMINNLKIANFQYKQAKEILEYYENKANNNSNEIIKVANKQYSNGEIDYLQWIFLINQSISIKNDYLNSISNYNKSIIELNYLNNN